MYDKPRYETVRVRDVWKPDTHSPGRSKVDVRKRLLSLSTWRWQPRCCFTSRGMARQCERACDKKSIVGVKLHQSMQPSVRTPWQERPYDADGTSSDIWTTEVCMGTRGISMLLGY